MPDPGRRAAIITLGCGRNEVDSDQVGGALTAAGWRITDDPEHADVVLVNTCTFIGPAREESVEVVLDARSFYLNRHSLVGAASADYAEVTEGLRLVSSGVVRPPVGHRFPLDDARLAYEAISDRSRNGKVVLHVS